MNIGRKIVLLLAVVLTHLVGMSAQSVRSEMVVEIDGRNYYIHTMGSGETLADVAATYALDAGEVMQENRIVQNDTIEAGRVLRIPCYERLSRLNPRRGDKRFDRVVPKKGESIFELAMEHAISLDTLIADNAGLNITDISNNAAINVRKSATRQTQLAEIEKSSRKMAAILNALSKHYEYFVVESGQTLYSLAANHAVSVEQMLKLNGNPMRIYVGMALRVPRMVGPAPMNYHITDFENEILTGQEADSLVVDGENGLTLAQFEGDVLTVSLMLPLTNKGKVRGNFVEFYQGALLAAEELKAEGKSLNLRLHDVSHNPEKVAAILEEETTTGERSDLFIGPIYEEDIAPLAGIDRPVVLPLTSRLDSIAGRNLYRLVPTDSAKVSKLSGMIGPETNVIMVYTPSIDENMEREMLELLGDHPYGKVIYNEEFVVDSLMSSPIEELMVKDDNLFMVLADNEIDTDRSLAIISSMMNSRQPKYGTNRVPIRVIGNADWAKYRNMDRNLLFKLDVSYLVPYHADRGNQRVKEFDRKFIGTFGHQPSMFAYRAYDALKLFGTAMFEGGDLTAALNGSVTQLLQVPYSFTEEAGVMVNDAWALVNYRPNYTIEVK